MRNIVNPGYVSRQGITSGVAYDTAWAARVTDERGKLIFPECVQWLLNHQNPDGSWGSHLYNYHDRIISTLSAVSALKEIDKRQYSQPIQKGETYIWENIKKMRKEPRLIGSELLVPSLMEQAESLGLNLPYHITIYRKEYNAKLKKVDESLWYSPLTTLSFSLEFLGDKVNVTQLAAVQLPNGSVATSPAATAFFLKYKKDAKAVRYLKEILSVTGDGSMMTVYPIEVFESSWIMYNFMLAGVYLEWFPDVCDYLHNHLKQSGVCWSVQSPLTSADETAVTLKVLRDMQYPVDFRILDHYKADDYYVTLPFELDPSVSTNIHVLEFIKSCPEFPEREETIEKLVHFLEKKMCSRGFWVDKWHVSPYYPTSHAVFALYDLDFSLAEKAVSWIVDTQHENGLWGANSGTLEETAYAVQALLHYYRTKRIEVRVSSPESCNAPPCTDLWVGKVLYTPVRVVWSSVISAQMRTGRVHTSPCTEAV